MLTPHLIPITLHISLPMEVRSSVVKVCPCCIEAEQPTKMCALERLSILCIIFVCLLLFLVDYVMHPLVCTLMACFTYQLKRNKQVETQGTYPLFALSLVASKASVNIFE